MSFELRDRDLLGRIGRLKTKSGEVETPAFMPVVNPINQTLQPQTMAEEYGCEILMTNSYIIMKNFGIESELEVHRLLDYEGVIATDSGAYQLLVYGEVETGPEEIIRFQQAISSDVAVILDIPTGWNESRKRVEYTVEETIRRARMALPLIEGDTTLWVGPVQGGTHLDLVERSAKEIGAMPFQIHALGSPTEVMENYKFTMLVKMIMTAKLNLPLERPLHLFGAGHPMMFAMAVALGCDLFDSAAYALYAKEERYLTTLGTKRLSNLSYLPCCCPVCSKISVDELQEMLKKQRIKTLTEHNLYATMSEMRRVKQAITEGTLWELIEIRSRAHPAMASAFKSLKMYKKELEKFSPGHKGRGIFFFGHESINRPEVTRHTLKLSERHAQINTIKILLLIPAPRWRPFSSSKEFQRLRDTIEKELGETTESIQICFFAAPFGVVPLELTETFPLSQFEISKPLDHETIQHTAELVESYFNKSNFQKTLLVAEKGELDRLLFRKFKDIGTDTDREIHILTVENVWSKKNIEEIVSTLKRMIKN